MTSRRMFSLLSLMFSLATSALAVGSLDGRAAQSAAICKTDLDFDWATNSFQLSPCSVSSLIWGACGTGTWNVPQLTDALPSYTNPNASTANLCSCSWAAYNLMSACTACQGYDNGVQNWAAYNRACGSFLTDTYFPSSVVLPKSAAIPYWAATNPQTWKDGHFDTAQAKLLAQQGKPDLVQPPTSDPKKKAPIGAIVGGVIGGLAVLCIGGLIFYYLTRKRNNQRQQLTEELDPRPYPVRPHIHGRSMSDLSGKSILAPQSMTASHRPTTVYTTGTIHTNTGSVHSLTYNSAYMSPVLESPTLPQTRAGNREDIIEPYVFHPTTPPAAMVRKPSETTINAAYNREAASPGPAEFHNDNALGDPSFQRVRLNPPAYSPYPSPASSPEPGAATPPRRDPALGHGTRNEKGSVDSQQSYESTSSGTGDTISAIHDIIGRMNLNLPAESTMGGHTVSTGQSANVTQRPTHKPNVSNPDNEALA